MITLDPAASSSDLIRIALAMIRSRKAEVVGIYNAPPESLNAALILTSERILAVERVLGFPVHINSGYRSERLNAAVGGTRTSQHTRAEAVDFVCPEYGTPRKIAERLALDLDSLGVDQLILEPGWVHISFTQTPRRSVLTKTEDAYVEGLA